MTAVSPPPAVEAESAGDTERRTWWDRPDWRFNASVAAVLVVIASLRFDRSQSLSSDLELVRALGLLLLLGLLVALGGTWLARLVWCARHHRLGHGGAALLAWLVAPLLVLGALGFERAVGGIDHLAFRLSRAEMERDATSRLAAAEVDSPRSAGDLGIGWLDVDNVTVDARITDGRACAGRFVSYEVEQGFMSGHGYVFSPDGPPCAEGLTHLEGSWYWARLWD